MSFCVTTPVACVAQHSSEGLLTCELQRAAQRPLSWSQQRQAMFGLLVLQTLHQRDGRVLHKLHQQLRRDTERTLQLEYSACCLMYSLSDSPFKMEHRKQRSHYLWLGVKLIRKHGSPCVEPVE